jgi:hypothetical protein
VYLSHEEAIDLAFVMAELADLLQARREGLAVDIASWAFDVASKLTRTVGEIFSEIMADWELYTVEEISKIREIALAILRQNGTKGVAIAGGWNTGYGFDLWIMNRDDGTTRRVELGWFMYRDIVPAMWDLGRAFGDDPQSGYHFGQDFNGFINCHVHRAGCD